LLTWGIHCGSISAKTYNYFNALFLTTFRLKDSFHSGAGAEAPTTPHRRGGNQETQETPRGHPGGQRRLRGKMCQNHGVVPSKVARPTISRRRERPDHHRLPRLRTKVGGRRGPAHPTHLSLTHKTIRQNPSSVATVWGIKMKENNIYIYIYMYTS